MASFQDDSSRSAHSRARTFWSSLASESSTTPSSSPAPHKDTASTDVSKKAATKRIRIPIACVNCRHKKIKCDGQTPCSHCEKFKAECVYPAATKPVNHEYVETLENRLKSVESHLQGLIGSTSRGQGQRHSHSPLEQPEADAIPPAESSTSSKSSFVSPAPHSIVSPVIQPHLNSGYAFLGTYSGGLTTPAINTAYILETDSPMDDQTFKVERIMGTLSLLMGNLKVDRDGTARFMSNLVEHQERSYTEIRAYRSTAEPPTMSSGLDWEIVDNPRPYTLPTHLLSRSAIDTLINTYFNSVHAFLPILHKSSFLTLCQGGEHRVPPFLLMAICAIASRHSTETELQSKIGFTSSHHALYDYARALLDSFIDIPRISTIQGLLLLAYYQIREHRAGQFFRARTYLNVAIRMARDMGLARDLYKTIDEIELAHTDDSVSTTASAIISMSPSYLTLSHRHQQRADSSASARSLCSGGRSQRKRLIAIHQERRLSWLACYFLDGLSSSLLGFEYGVPHVHPEMRKLIREANYATDTTQGATLIFWYLHLDLVHLYRRICDMYRLSTSQSESVAMSAVIQGTEMLSIEHAFESWITRLPAHLVYTRKTQPEAIPQDQADSKDALLTSYYTLYLHRYYHSVKLLLHRPLIASRVHRGNLSDPNSAISKCVNAASLLTDIGETIFQNYSWPWPGCGLFAYHMLQAIEIHVYCMITRTSTEAQDMYLRTMDLIKGYAILAKLPELEKDLSAMNQAVSNHILKEYPIVPTHTPLSILQQLQQSQQQQEQERYLSGMKTSFSGQYSQLSFMTTSVSSTTPVSTYHTQHQLHINQSLSQVPPVDFAGAAEDTRMQSPPSQPNTSFPAFPVSCASSLVSTDMLHMASPSEAFSTAFESVPVAAMPPPKPPKRVHDQSTGSTNSSSVSHSYRPPVPKKPTQLVGMGPGASLAPFAHHQHQQVFNEQGQPGSNVYSVILSPPPTDTPSSAQASLPTVRVSRRPIKVLQAQKQLYGCDLKTPLGQGGEGVDDADTHAKFFMVNSEMNEYVADYMKLSPHRPHVL
ncbi:fungal-specific transcription factor domain-containing protein [Gamsiella multidivaricata]|uniref:fungal-specific transcription factor domain-containing protein n=1 Tax=Gamsiella multidivaricata TaxID=101098 RepID=UPI00221ED878|nr:fungal-specific transcription factor domain-containing protein [Gamsiella multidivaricata]KAI7817702.1 fungal-specific transcription factor domain-containing protein [Gamsiella multidivaricata]